MFIVFDLQPCRVSQVFYFWLRLSFLYFILVVTSLCSQLYSLVPFFTHNAHKEIVSSWQCQWYFAIFLKCDFITMTQPFPPFFMWLFWLVMILYAVYSHLASCVCFSQQCFVLLLLLFFYPSSNPGDNIFMRCDGKELERNKADPHATLLRWFLFTNDSW